MMTTDWERQGSRRRAIKVELIEPFNARGMKNVYGRGDHFGNGRTFHMDIWLAKDSRVFARFWSYGSEVDWESYEIFGLPNPLPRIAEKGCEKSEDWAPQCLRQAYDSWIITFI